MKPPGMSQLQLVKLNYQHISQTQSILDQHFGKDYLSGEAIKSYIADKDKLCIIAISNNEVLGVSMAIMGRIKDLSDLLLKEKTWFINAFETSRIIGFRKHLAVKSGYERRGIGSTLIKESVRMLEESCDAIVTIVWREGNGKVMDILMNKNDFQEKLMIPNYWEKDSIDKNYVCPKCMAIPCGCSAVVYVKQKI